jgi:hypothetical protein
MSCCDPFDTHWLLNSSLIIVTLDIHRHIVIVDREVILSSVPRHDVLMLHCFGRCIFPELPQTVYDRRWSYHWVYHLVHPLSFALERGDKQGGWQTLILRHQPLPGSEMRCSSLKQEVLLHKRTA